MTVYVPEEFTPAEADTLRRYFTNLDGPVFALVNLPEVVKGALFARYSRSPKSLRRLFLDEFVGDLDISGDHSVDATVGLERAEELYEKVFFEYGDDSVAQLGGVHLACEQASNILTKILEWGRLMSYLEQSTRYIAYDARLGGRYRFYRDPAVLSQPVRHALRRRHGPPVRRLLAAAQQGHRPRPGHGRPRPDDSDFVFRQATRAKALDAVRGVLPAASLSQRRHLRQRPGVRGAAAADARPSAARGPALRRPDAARAAQGHPQLPAPGRPRRSWRPVDATTSPPRASAPPSSSTSLFGGTPVEHAPSVQLVDWDPDAEDKLLAAICYPHTNLPEIAAAATASARSAPTERLALDPRLRRRAGEPPAQARAGRSSGSTTASTCSATTARSATCSATAC